MATDAPTEAALQPTDPEVLFEVVDGRLVELPPMGTPSVWITSRIQARLATFAEERGLGVAVAEMLFTLRKTPLLRRRPDVAFVSADRWPLDRPLVEGNGWEVVPELAVEVVSPSDTVDDVIGRIHDFFAAGTATVWLVLPRTRQVYIYDGPGAIRVLGVGDDLDGGALLPGFRCPVATIFPPTAPPA